MKFRCERANEGVCGSPQVMDLLVLFILHSTNANQSRRGAERLLKVKVRTGLMQEALLQRTFRDFAQVRLLSIHPVSNATTQCTWCSSQNGDGCVLFQWWPNQWCLSLRSCEVISPQSSPWLRVCCAPPTPAWCLLEDTCTTTRSPPLTLTANKWVQHFNQSINQNFIYIALFMHYQCLSKCFTEK